MQPARFLLIFSLLLFPFWTFAQNGILSGTVSDDESGEPLIGATIAIVGTYKGGLSDEAGRFRIVDIKPGDYSIKITYVGYSEKIYNGITVAQGATQSLDIKLQPTYKTLGEVEIVGDRGLVDLESGQSSVNVGREVLSEMNAMNVQDVAAMQVGVQKSPDGLQIRGGRVYETEYLVNGISAQDPLAGTGFGVEVNTQAVQNVEITTGGAGAEFGGGSSGVISTKIREGGKKFSVNASYMRDNLGFDVDAPYSFNTDEASLSISGPIWKDKISFFVLGSAHASDNYFGPVADQLRSSLLVNDTMWAPRQDNRWATTANLVITPAKGIKITLTNQHSLNINQSTRSLQIVGNDAIVSPGFQFPFSLNLDNANTYTHSSDLSILNITGVLGKQWSYNVSAGRLFTNLRADANGRAFRNETVDQIFDPASIVTDPVSVFNPNSQVVYVFPGPGLINNGGIATLWHDHYAQEYTFKTKFTFSSENGVHYVSMGQEHKEQEYLWIDVTRPWVGAPIQINDSTTTPSTSLGRSSDFWKVNPATGGVFVEDEIRYKGIIANLGLRMNYWAPGTFADEAVANPAAPVLDAVREAYLDQTTALLGRRWKARLLPRLRVSFPVTENNVLYFNYGHAMRLPHPRFVYAGLDPVYQDRSFLSNLGNPNINPEVTVSYEVGLKSKLTKDLALTVTAFYNDKFDYIVSRRIEVQDITGRFVEKTFFINQDYARIRGVEVGLSRRVGSWLLASLTGSYQIATGKSNSAAESALQIRQQGFVNTTKEQFLAWDRPFDVKGYLILTGSDQYSLGKLSTKGFSFSTWALWQSGLRYTPYQLVRVNETSGRPEYEPIDNQPFARVGSPWFKVDMALSKKFFVGKTANLQLTIRVENVTNYLSAQIINGVTGTAWNEGDPTPLSWRDPAYPDPQDSGLLPNNPARFQAPRQLLFKAAINF
ncbi:MAG: TonB-dependent receptor [Bacteroidia bacterium]|nr:TonB-dependent receptor [Bacteroidia bacterium]